MYIDERHIYVMGRETLTPARMPMKAFHRFDQVRFFTMVRMSKPITNVVRRLSLYDIAVMITAAKAGILEPGSHSRGKACRDPSAFDGFDCCECFDFLVLFRS
jgi:hypothetical protein